MKALLRSLRERSGLPVDDAAGRIGVSRATVYAWEAGTKEPDKESLRRLVEVYAATDEERVELARLRAFGEAAPPVSAAG